MSTNPAGGAFTTRGVAPYSWVCHRATGRGRGAQGRWSCAFPGWLRYREAQHRRAAHRVSRSSCTAGRGDARITRVAGVCSLQPRGTHHGNRSAARDTGCDRHCCAASIGARSGGPMRAVPTGGRTATGGIYPRPWVSASRSRAYGAWPPWRELAYAGYDCACPPWPAPGSGHPDRPKTQGREHDGNILPPRPCPPAR